MSEIRAKLEKDLVQAAKSKDALRLTTLRMLKSAIRNKEIDTIVKELDDAGILAILATMIKQRHDSVDCFIKGDRKDLADKEEAEIKILLEFLPPQLSKDEIKAKAAEAIKMVGAKGMQDLGKVMKEIVPLISGRASGKDVSEAVKELLSAK